MMKVLFVCHGNICRSTMAESMFTYMVNQRGVADQFEIDSAATSREEIGNTPHYGTVGKLREVGIPLVPHRARQMTMSDYDYYDYLIGMDSANIRNMQRIAGGRSDKIYKMLDFISGEGRGRDVADPWYTDNFDATYNDLTSGLNAFLRYLEDKGEIGFFFYIVKYIVENMYRRVYQVCTTRSARGSRNSKSRISIR